MLTNGDAASRQRILSKASPALVGNIMKCVSKNARGKCKGPAAKKRKAMMMAKNIMSQIRSQRGGGMKHKRNVLIQNGGILPLLLQLARPLLGPLIKSIMGN